MSLRLVPLAPPPPVEPCTVDTTPEEWAPRHLSVLPAHAVEVSAWGALCRTCGAVWSRDPAMGGEARRSPGSLLPRPAPADGPAQAGLVGEETARGGSPASAGGLRLTLDDPAALATDQRRRAF